MIEKEAAQQLDAIVANRAAPLAALTAVVMKKGEILATYAGGRRFIASQKGDLDLPARSDTKFRAASISKLVTTIGVLRLVDQGLIALDEDLSAYLGFTLRNPHFPAEPITLERLLSHTSSIRDGTAYTMPLPHRLVEFFDPVPGSPYHEQGAHWSLERPGAFFCYSNLNFGVIGTLIERLTGRRFDRYMAEEVLRPLGLSAGYNVADLPGAALGNLAALYRQQRPDGVWTPGRWFAQVDDLRGRRPLPLAIIENPDASEKYGELFGHIAPRTDLAAYEIGSNGTIFSPQGGLRISAVELAAIMRLLINDGRLGDKVMLRPETVSTMKRPRWLYDPAGQNGDSHQGLMRGWGLGLQLFTGSGSAGDGDRLLAGRDWRPVGHLGDAYGLLSGLLFDETGDGLVYMIGGVGRDPQTAGGRYSSLTRWEEEVLTVLAEVLFF